MNRRSRNSGGRTRRRAGRDAASERWLLLIFVVAFIAVIMGVIDPWSAAVDGPERDKPMSMAEARASNAAVPVEPRWRVPAAAYRFRGRPAGREQAADCLATAALYEVGDDRRGQQAVIQVILNRVRAAGFPKTVCGVVYQGFARSTGLPVLLHLRRIVRAQAGAFRLGASPRRGTASALRLRLRRRGWGHSIPCRLGGAVLARLTDQGGPGRVPSLLCSRGSAAPLISPLELSGVRAGRHS